MRARLGGRRKGVFAKVFASGAGPETYPVWSLPANVSDLEFGLRAIRYGILELIFLNRQHSEDVFLSKLLTPFMWDLLWVCDPLRGPTSSNKKSSLG